MKSFTFNCNYRKPQSTVRGATDDVIVRDSVFTEEELAEKGITEGDMASHIRNGLIVVSGESDDPADEQEQEQESSPETVTVTNLVDGEQIEVLQSDIDNAELIETPEEDQIEVPVNEVTEEVKEIIEPMAENETKNKKAPATSNKKQPVSNDNK